MSGIYAIVLAGGSGQRMGSPENKVFLPLLGTPAIIWALRPFTSLCCGAVIVARADEVERMRQIICEYDLHWFVVLTVAGGYDRQASVVNGLAALPADAEIVLIHDGARALITEPVIRNTILAVQQHGSGVASVPVTDTIRRLDASRRVLETIPRETLFTMQTPQGFMVKTLKDAHQKAASEDYRATDDAALLERAGFPVQLCEGDRENIKLTTPLDIALAELILKSRAGGGQT